jgi:hypothetical protein
MPDPNSPADGGGPGGHPGVTPVLITGDVATIKAAVEAVLENGGKLAIPFPIMATDGVYAFFASGYK